MGPCLARKASLSEDAPPKANEKAHERLFQRLLCFKTMAVGNKRWAKGKIEGNCLMVKRPSMITQGELTDYSNQRGKRFFII